MAGTTSDKLSKLAQTKENFKTTMTDMGLDVTEELPFGGYPSLLSEVGVEKRINLTVTIEYSNWQRCVMFARYNNNGVLVNNIMGDTTETKTFEVPAGSILYCTVSISPTQFVGPFTAFERTYFYYDGRDNKFYLYAYRLGDQDVEVSI